MPIDVVDLLNDPSCAPALGQGSTIRCTATTARSGLYAYAICCHNDTMFSVLTENDAAGSFAAVTIPAGSTIYGKFTAFTISAGSPTICVSVHKL